MCACFVIVSVRACMLGASAGVSVGVCVCVCDSLRFVCVHNNNSNVFVCALLNKFTNAFQICRCGNSTCCCCFVSFIVTLDLAKREESRERTVPAKCL